MNLKIDLDVEIDWLNEDETIDDRVSGEIKDQLVLKIMDKINPEIEKKISEIALDTVDKEITKTYEEFMDKDFTVYDRWGDVKEKNVNVKKLLKKKFDDFMIEKTRDGNLKYEEILNRSVKDSIDSFTTKVSREVLNGIHEDINEMAREKVVNAILSDYKLKDLIK